MNSDVSTTREYAVHVRTINGCRELTRVATTDDDVRALFNLYRDASESPNLVARLETREVTIVTTATEWESFEPCTYTHSHTRHWCGNAGCRDS